jgi:hypothetical protein
VNFSDNASVNIKAWIASYYLQSYDHLIKGTRKYNLWYPYYSIFDPVEDVDREKLYIHSMRESLNLEESND